MDVSLDNVFDLPRLASCRLEIDIHVALGIDDRCDALRPNHVRCVGQTTQIESFHLYRFHAFPPGQRRRPLADREGAVQPDVVPNSTIAAALQAADMAGQRSSPPDISASPRHWRRKAQ